MVSSYYLIWGLISWWLGTKSQTQRRGLIVLRLPSSIVSDIRSTSGHFRCGERTNASHTCGLLSLGTDIIKCERFSTMPLYRKYYRAHHRKSIANAPATQCNSVCIDN